MLGYFFRIKSNSLIDYNLYPEVKKSLELESHHMMLIERHKDKI